MAEVLTPRCPLCDGPPMMVVADQAFCGTVDCSLLNWTLTMSLDENLLAAKVVHLPPLTET